MPNVHDDDEETLIFADESGWMDEQDSEVDRPDLDSLRIQDLISYEAAAFARRAVEEGW